MIDTYSAKFGIAKFGLSNFNYILERYVYDTLLKKLGESKSHLLDIILSSTEATDINYLIDAITSLGISRKELIDTIIAGSVEASNYIDSKLKGIDTTSYGFGIRLFRFVFIDYAKQTNQSLYDMITSHSNLFNMVISNSNLYSVLNTLTNLYAMGLEVETLFTSNNSVSSVFSSDIVSNNVYTATCSNNSMFGINVSLDSLFDAIFEYETCD